MDLRKETVSPIAVVRDSIQIFVMQAKSKNITLELLTSGKSHPYPHSTPTYARLIPIQPFGIL